MAMELSGCDRAYAREDWQGVQKIPDRGKEVLTELEETLQKKDALAYKDEYISSEKSGSKPSGLYYLGKDENGNPRVVYDDWKREIKPGKEADEPGKKAEKCTTNTDKVDREIEKLKEEKKQLEQQIKAAAGEEEKVKEWKKKLAQIEMELSWKDNETYRRQNSVTY